jgi:hypothetical protein
MIMNVVFNVTSDLMIFLIPLPILFKSSLPWKRRLLLVLPFTMGIFTIFAAIICKVEALLLLSTEWWGLWCCREASMAVIVTNVPYSWGLVRRWTNAGSFFAPSSDRSPEDSAKSSWNDSKQGLLKAARNSFSFGSSRKQSVASRNTSRQSCSEDVFVKNDQYDGRRSSTAIRYPPETRGFPVSSSTRQSISAAAVDKLYKLDSLDESLEEKRMTAALGMGRGDGNQSPSWVPGTAAMDKLCNLNECDGEKDDRGRLADDASAPSSADNPLSGEGSHVVVEAHRFFGDFEFGKQVESSSGDAA